MFVLVLVLATRKTEDEDEDEDTALAYLNRWFQGSFGQTKPNIEVKDRNKPLAQTSYWYDAHDELPPLDPAPSLRSGEADIVAAPPPAQAAQRPHSDRFPAGAFVGSGHSLFSSAEEKSGQVGPLKAAAEWRGSDNGDSSDSVAADVSRRHILRRSGTESVSADSLPRLQFF